MAKIAQLKHLQSLHQLRGERVPLIALFHGIPGAGLHHQAVLNVHIQSILGVYLLLFVAGQEFSNHIAEYGRVSPAVVDHRLRETFIEFRQIIQIDGDQNLLSMG